jgi:glycosyltransferase involved in cell wall biosynthesis
VNACLIAYTDYDVDFRVRRYAEMLRGEKGRVDAIALRGRGQEEYGTLNGVNVYRILERDDGEKGIAGYLTGYLRFMLSGARLMARLGKNGGYDVVHVHNVPDFLVFMAILPRMCGAKVVLDIHDILPEFFCQKYRKTMDSGFARLLRVVEWLSVRFADHVIVANDLWREKIVARNGLRPDRCTTIMNYPPLEFFGRNGMRKPEGAFRMVYPGTLSRQHGVDILVRATAAAVSEIPNLELHIYGHKDASPIRKELDELIRELGISDAVHFHKPVPPETLAPLLSDFDVGVVPKRGGVFAGEAFSTKVFDFMAAGIPVIASRTKIDMRYFDDSQIQFFDPEDHEGLARCIVGLYQDPERRASLAERGRKYVESNNWDVKKEIYAGILETLSG